MQPKQYLNCKNKQEPGSWINPVTRLFPPTLTWQWQWKIKKQKNRKRIQVFTHQFNPGSQSFQYPVSLLCLFLVKEHRKKCISRPPASLSSPRQQGERAHLVAGRTDGWTGRWTRRLLLELLTQAGPKAPCLSSRSPLQEKKKNAKKKNKINK